MTGHFSQASVARTVPLAVTTGFHTKLPEEAGGTKPVLLEKQAADGEAPVWALASQRADGSTASV